MKTTRNHRTTMIGLTAARRTIYDLVQRVEAGESFTLLRAGRPVAELTPIDPAASAAGRNRRIRAALKRVAELTFDTSNVLPPEQLITDPRRPRRTRRAAP